MGGRDVATPPTIMMSCFIVVVAFPSVILVASGQAYEFGKERAKEAGKNPATTIIKLAQRNPRVRRIERGESSDKIGGFDPAVAPLGTDDEAAGVPTHPVEEDANPGGAQVRRNQFRRG